MRGFGQLEGMGPRACLIHPAELPPSQSTVFMLATGLSQRLAQRHYHLLAMRICEWVGHSSDKVSFGRLATCFLSSWDCCQKCQGFRDLLVSISFLLITCFPSSHPPKMGMMIPKSSFYFYFYHLLSPKDPLHEVEAAMAQKNPCC